MKTFTEMSPAVEHKTGEVDRYLALGWSIIPIAPGDKKPLVSWKLAQKKPLDRDTLIYWAKRYPSMGLAVVCGSISGICALDFDDPKLTHNAVMLAGLPITAKSRTGRETEAWHVFFKLPVGEEFPKIVGFREKLEFIGEGGYAILPPSLHKSGRNYEWEVEPEHGLAELPADLLTELRNRAKRTPAALASQNGKRDWNIPFYEGERDEVTFKYACYLVKKLDRSLWDLAGFPTLRAWHHQFCMSEPLSDDVIQEKLSQAITYAKAESGPVDIITHKELMENPPEPKSYAIKDFLVNGLTLFVAGAKQGKTTILMQTAMAVAYNLPLFGDINGEPTLGFDVNPGQVLYLALEDGKPNIYKLANEMLEGHRVSGENLSFGFSFPAIHSGGCEEIERWVKSQRNPRLVVIDTFSRFKDTPKQRNNDVWQQDKMNMDKLQALALKNKICIVTTFHTRKTTAVKTAAITDSLAGTGGLTAGADNNILFKVRKNKEKASLGFMSRDYSRDDVILTRSSTGSKRWNLQGRRKPDDITFQPEEDV